MLFLDKDGSFLVFSASSLESNFDLVFLLTIATVHQAQTTIHKVQHALIRMKIPVSATNWCIYSRANGYVFGTCTLGFCEIFTISWNLNFSDV